MERRADKPTTQFSTLMEQPRYGCGPLPCRNPPFLYPNRPPTLKDPFEIELNKFTHPRLQNLRLRNEQKISYVRNVITTGDHKRGLKREEGGVIVHSTLRYRLLKPASDKVRVTRRSIFTGGESPPSTLLGMAMVQN